MTKKRYKNLISVVLLLLCVAPLIYSALMMLSDATNCSAVNFTEYVERFEISSSLSDKIGESISTFGIEFDGAFFPAVCVLMSNAMLVYIFYIFVAVITWLPKFAIKLLERSVSYE